jgi:hypothetical protein
MNVYEQVLLPAAEDYNRTFNQGGQVQKSRDALLSGDGGALDSLELVNFIVVVERKIRETTGKEVRLVTEEALRAKSSPFLTLNGLEQFINERLGSGGTV